MILALKVLHPGNPLGPGQTRTIDHANKPHIHEIFPVEESRKTSNYQREREKRERET